MPIKNKHITSPYYSIGQLRLAKWNALKLECTELSHAKRGSASEKNHFEEVKTTLNHLKCIECYFVFPGKVKIEKLLHSLERAEYTRIHTFSGSGKDGISPSESPLICALYSFL